MDHQPDHSTAIRPRARPNLATLARSVAREAASAALPSGIPRFDEATDQAVRALPSYAPFASALAVRIGANYGSEGSEYRALEWVYRSRDSLPLSWRRFLAEVTSPTFEYWGLSLLGGVALPRGSVRFGDGLALVRRSERDLRRLPFWSPQLERVVMDVVPGAGISWCVMVHRAEHARRPDNWLTSNEGDHHDPMERLLLAIRLSNSSDVWSSAVYHGRSERFAGLSSSLPMGPTFRWPSTPEPITLGLTVRTYTRLAAAATRLRGDLTHVDNASRRFALTYDRARTRESEALVDDVIALEGAIGRDGQELSYSLAFRVAGMLERESENRIQLFRSIGTFYKVRSRIVHGDRLRRSDLDVIRREPELRDIVRRVLRGMLAMVGTDFDPTRAFIDDGLDAVLMSETERRRLVLIANR